MTAHGPYREFKLRLPPEIADRIEAKALAEGRTQNGVIRSELMAFPVLEQQASLTVSIQLLDAALVRLHQIETLVLTGKGPPLLFETMAFGPGDDIRSWLDSIKLKVTHGNRTR